MEAAMQRVREVMQRYWGYASFRPLQEEAIQSVLSGGDSLVVLPTGGGKSLCFQAPAMTLPGLAIVVSPLIALMKDQVDALKAAGVPAASLNSSCSEAERLEAQRGMRSGNLKLLYVAPERAVNESFLQSLSKIPLSFIAIDEAHCISAWGHDFRPEYRGLRVFREAFPQVGVHAYTATATEAVRRDIVDQLGLRRPGVFVGSFDRPNLFFKAVRRTDRIGQTLEVIKRHSDESGIIYCISRKEVDNLSATLQSLGYKALPYHAGMEDGDRKRNQEAFLKEEADIIVATVAFGMGIDKSNVRYVLHNGMPKSLEHYQQEAGRAGRDGLEAECCLLYSSSDLMTWKRLLSDLPPEPRKTALAKLDDLFDYCVGDVCRHKAVVQYFGQEFTKEGCGACDVCLGVFETIGDPLILAQKVLSCVARIRDKCTAAYASHVLRGSSHRRILENGHQELSTYGILSAEREEDLKGYIRQLTRQEFLAEEGPYGDLSVTEKGRLLLAGKTAPVLKRRIQDSGDSRSGRRTSEASWEGVDRELFDLLRNLRRRKAEERGVPPFILFHDSALREMARRRPSTREGIQSISGVGERKAADFGVEFLAEITRHCRAKSLSTDQPSLQADPGEARTRNLTHAMLKAFTLFRSGASVEQAAREIERAHSTTWDYLAEFVQREKVTDPDPWMARVTLDRIHGAAREVGAEKLKPVFERLGGEVSYNEIRIGLACLRNNGVVLHHGGNVEGLRPGA
jgi:ATP-dependent DNA helicase RecQ